VLATSGVSMTSPGHSPSFNAVFWFAWFQFLAGYLDDMMLLGRKSCFDSRYLLFSLTFL